MNYFANELGYSASIMTDCYTEGTYVRTRADQNVAQAHVGHSSHQAAEHAHAAVAYLTTRQVTGGVRDAL